MRIVIANGSKQAAFIIGDVQEQGESAHRDQLLAQFC
jgi:hypothetical protein